MVDVPKIKIQEITTDPAPTLEGIAVPHTRDNRTYKVGGEKLAELVHADEVNLPLATDGIAHLRGVTAAGGSVRSDVFPFEPITNHGAATSNSAATNTTKLNAAVSVQKALYIPAGAWRFNALTGAARVTWLIDPGATFPDLPTKGPFGQTDLSNLGGRIYRFSNADITYQGVRYGSGDPWPEDYRAYSVAISEFSVTSDNGQIAVGGFSRASDRPSVNQGCIGAEFIAVNDDETYTKPVFPTYTEGWRTSASVGAALNEFEMINQGDVIDLSPISDRGGINAKDTIALVAASGGGDVVGVNAATAAMAVWNNGAYWRRGIVFRDGSLDPTGTLEAIAMMNSHKVAWYSLSGSAQIAWQNAASAQWMAQADADTSGYSEVFRRRKLDNVTATDSLDRIARHDYYGWTGSSDYAGAYAQILQRTNFSGGNARFSYDISAKNTAGSDVQVTLNGIADNSFAPFPDNTLSSGTSSARWANNYATNFRPGAGTAIWTSGTGTPEGAVTAPVGSLFTRTDGGAGTTFYVKESGSGNTGWVAK